MVKWSVENVAVAQQVSPAFLVVDGESVYEVAPNSVMNIGRLENNDIVLDDYKVSREHAVLKYSVGQFTLVDLASTHGTLLNGKRIDRSPVQFGDRIQITSHELTLSREVPLQDVPTSKMARSLDRRLKFFGGLNDFSLITLVQFLSQEKQSGLLLLELGQDPGPRVYFQDGEIIHVSNGGDLAELLTRQHHEQSLFFYFHHETHFPPRTIMESTPNYLMSLCHSYDQRREEKVRAAKIAQTTGPLALTTRIKTPARPR
jgi:pSer/pThr/pTyr-binding forkhead associated (FHA) protein